MDRERPLNKRGHRNATDMAHHLAGREQRPDHLITSPARRAFTTAEYFANELSFPLFDMEIEEHLYFCGIKGWLRVLRKLPESCQSVMLFGHNPEVSQLINYLSGKEEDAIPTCTIAKLYMTDIPWSDIADDSCTLAYLKSPKDRTNIDTQMEKKTKDWQKITH